MRSLPRSRLQAQKATLPGTVPEGTRRRILETALRLFASHGFHGTSIRDVAKELGLQPSALYSHFPAKENILAELVQVGHETLHEVLRTALLNAGSEPAEQVRALVRAHTILHATHSQLAVVVNEELHALPPELAAPALALRHQASALLLEVVKRGVAMGRFSPPHLEATAAAISAMGVRIPYWYEPAGALTADSLAELHAELALRMLGGR
ncbi:TetR/AcrR family transcriptional regulator [Archangium lansingense]|uniref:TetR/AcrR family transcriptional regulator n=1 Tax=Archangium lansingense TaxID=2995310 RepID=A0ABT4AGQ8_9BACT|nr:TetR/AcrR family transcriptional regulator [Archangium lansinium]MCY1080863.1 TetR/AcrR family transcriptional regulator [Archangium lansinium]